MQCSSWNEVHQNAIVQKCSIRHHGKTQGDTCIQIMHAIEKHTTRHHLHTIRHGSVTKSSSCLAAGTIRKQRIPKCMHAARATNRRCARHVKHSPSTLSVGSEQSMQQNLPAATNTKYMRLERLQERLRLATCCQSTN